MIFVDTSFWVALRNRRDPHHQEAVALLRRHADEPLITSNQVRGETWTHLRRKAGHAAAVDFLDVLKNSSRVRTVTVELRREEEALRWLRRHDERAYSFVDATSFSLMRSLRTRRALAFDDDFSTAGFHPLRLCD